MNVSLPLVRTRRPATRRGRELPSLDHLSGCASNERGMAEHPCSREFIEPAPSHESVPEMVKECMTSRARYQYNRCDTRNKLIACAGCPNKMAPNSFDQFTNGLHR